MFCPKCGTKIGDFDKFCNNCGWKNKLTYKSDGIDLSGAKKAADIAKGVVTEKADDISKKVGEIGKNVTSKTKEINDKAITPFFDRAIDFFKRRVDIFFSIAALVALRVATIVPYNFRNYDIGKKVGDHLWATSVQDEFLDYFIYGGIYHADVLLSIIIMVIIFILCIVFNNIFANIFRIVSAIILGLLFYLHVRRIINGWDEYNSVSFTVALGLATLFLS